MQHQWHLDKYVLLHYAAPPSFCANERHTIDISRTFRFWHASPRIPAVLRNLDPDKQITPYSLLPGIGPCLKPSTIFREPNSH